MRIHNEFTTYLFIYLFIYHYYRSINRGFTYMQRHVLHCLHVSDWIKFRLCISVYKCVHGMTPGYLSELRRPASALQGRRHLRSAGRGYLDLPRVRRATFGKQSFAYAGPSAWNSLPDDLRDTSLSLSIFRSNLKS